MIALLQSVRGKKGGAMQKRGTIRMALLAISMVSSFWGINKLCDFFLRASHVSFSFDSFLTHTQQEKIKFAVTHAGILDPESIAHLIKAKCPAIEHVAVSRQPNHSFHITLTTAKPFVCINGEWILSTAGALAPRNHFTSETISALPLITMKSMAHAVPVPSAVFKKWLLQLDKTIFDRYFITWNHDYDITLTEKFNPTFALITTATHQMSEQTLTLCEKIKDEIKQQTTKPDQKILKADFRFDNQIVLSGDIGGIKHG